MKKKYLLPIIFLYTVSYGQLGINTVTPKSTLDVASNKTDGSTAEGFIIPRVTGATLKIAESNGVYGPDQDAILVYVTKEPEPDDRTGQVEGMDTPGFYHFDSGSNRWVKMLVNATETAAVSQLVCSSASHIGVLEDQEPAAGVYTLVPYNGGNGGIYAGEVIPSLGVTGLNAVLSSGTLNTGSGNLVFDITGTPDAAGTAVFTVNIGGETCGFTRTVLPSSNFADVVDVIVNGQIRQMMTRNLGADPTQDPNIPTQAIMGNYYQWGKLAPVATAYTGSGSISGWSTTVAANKSWNSGTESAPVKTAKDPCPSGYRVPTRNEWVGFVSASTIQPNLGTWTTSTSDGATNFSAAKVLSNNGNTLTFPAEGLRNNTVGGLGYRAREGSYWSSTENVERSYTFSFTSGGVNSANYSTRTYAFAVRCISQ